MWMVTVCVGRVLSERLPLATRTTPIYSVTPKKFFQRASIFLNGASSVLSATTFETCKRHSTTGLYSLFLTFEIKSLLFSFFFSMAFIGVTLIPTSI